MQWKKGKEEPRRIMGEGARNQNSPWKVCIRGGRQEEIQFHNYGKKKQED